MKYLTVIILLSAFGWLRRNRPKSAWNDAEDFVLTVVILGLAVAAFVTM
jgi:hypothetical protein